MSLSFVILIQSKVEYFIFSGEWVWK